MSIVQVIFSRACVHVRACVCMYVCNVCVCVNVNGESWHARRPVWSLAVYGVGHADPGARVLRFRDDTVEEAPP